MNNASTVAATTASSHTILTTLSPVFTYLIYIPTKFIILTAIPIIFQYAYLAITYTLHYLAVMLRIALIPVLYPLDLFLWRPCMAVILLFYQVKHQ